MPVRWLVVALLSLVAASAEARIVWIENVRTRAGDDRAWSSPAFDDSSWSEVPFWRTQGGDTIVWMRGRITIPPDLKPPTAPVGVYVGMLASHELWWDGELIGRGGVVGATPAAETPGPVETQYQVPDRLAAPGVHTIAVRTSAFHRGFDPLVGYWTIAVGDYDQLLRARQRYAWIAFIALSGMVVTGVFAFAMFLINRRDRGFLLLALLCFSAAAMLVAEEWRPLFGYTYDWHIVRLLAVTFAAWLTAIQLVLLPIVRFPHRHGRRLAIAVVAACSIAPFIPRGWDPKVIVLFVIAVPVAAAWTIFATWRRMRGSVLALIGITPITFMLLRDPYHFPEQPLYFSLDFLFVALLCSHALEVRRERHERAEALLKSARLEVELLRRHMQPHFVMNTLTALSEWIEQEPKTAVRMIDALADELRILSDVSSRKLIAVDDELRLCRTHLENMSLRKDVRYALEVDGVDGRQLVPPAIFHTLVENAVTHGAAEAGAMTLRLTARGEGDRVRYVFESPAADAPSESSIGTGTRYIEARLRESWGDAWSFVQGRAGAVWRAELLVPATT